MLKDPGKLREQSRIALRTARNSVDDAANQRLTAAALLLAEVAEAIERGDEATVKRLEGEVADARSIVDAFGGRQDSRRKSR